MVGFHILPPVRQHSCRLIRGSTKKEDRERVPGLLFFLLLYPNISLVAAVGLVGELHADEARCKGGGEVVAPKAVPRAEAQGEHEGFGGIGDAVVHDGKELCYLFRQLVFRSDPGQYVRKGPVDLMQHELQKHGGVSGVIAGIDGAVIVLYEPLDAAFDGKELEDGVPFRQQGGLP